MKERKHKGEGFRKIELQAIANCVCPILNVVLQLHSDISCMNYL